MALAYSGPPLSEREVAVVRNADNDCVVIIKVDGKKFDAWAVQIRPGRHTVGIEKRCSNIRPSALVDIVLLAGHTYDVSYETSGESFRITDQTVGRNPAPR